MRLLRLPPNFQKKTCEAMQDVIVVGVSTSNPRWGNAWNYESKTKAAMVTPES
jgi:hypothetical protein